MGQKIDKYIKLIAEQPKNDYNIPLLYWSILEEDLGITLLTEKGINILQNETVVDCMKRLDLEPMHQKTLKRLTLYLSLCYKIITRCLREIKLIEDNSLIFYLLRLNRRTLALLEDYKECILEWDKRILNCEYLSKEYEECLV